MSTIRQINSTVDYFITDLEDRQAIKLYIYQSVLNMTKSEAANQVGLSTRKAYELRQIHLKQCKESDKYRSDLVEIEMDCSNKFLRLKWDEFNSHRKEVSKRSQGLFLSRFPTRKYRTRLKPQLKLEF